MNRRRDDFKKSHFVSLRVEKEKKEKKSDDDDSVVWGGGQSFPLYVLFFFLTFERRETKEDDDREEEEDALFSLFLYFLFETTKTGVVVSKINEKMSNCCRHILSLSLKSIVAKVERD